jgi:hypothetical protein
VDVSLATGAVSGSVQARAVEALAGLAWLAAWARELGPFAGVALALAGVMALAAAERLRRVTALAGGAAIGALAAMAARSLVAAHAGLSAGAAAGLGAGVLGATCAALPAAFPAAAGGLVGALLGVHVPVGGSAAFGAGIAALVGGLIALAGARSVAIVLASFAGGLAVVIGLVTLGGDRALASDIAARPFVMLGFALVTGIAGAAFQLGAERPPGRAGPPKLPEDA